MKFSLHADTFTQTISKYFIGNDRAWKITPADKNRISLEIRKSRWWRKLDGDRDPDSAIIVINHCRWSCTPSLPVIRSKYRDTFVSQSPLSHLHNYSNGGYIGARIGIGSAGQFNIPVISKLFRLRFDRAISILRVIIKFSARSASYTYNSVESAAARRNSPAARASFAKFQRTPIAAKLPLLWLKRVLRETLSSVSGLGQHGSVGFDEFPRIVVWCQFTIRLNRSIGSRSVPIGR